MAMAPPLGFTCSASSGKPRSRVTARACAAKASFSSITSICERFSPVLSRIFRVAGAGANPMMRGATPMTVVATMRASGVRPNFEAAIFDAMINAHAPSFTPEAFPAVTVPFGFTIGLSFERASSVVSGRGCSSVSKILASPFFCGIGTATISCLKKPAA